MIVVPDLQSHAVIGAPGCATVGVYTRFVPELLPVSWVARLPEAVTVMTPVPAVTAGGPALAVPSVEQPLSVARGNAPLAWSYSATEVLQTPAELISSV